MAALRQQSADRQVGQVIVCGADLLAGKAPCIAADLDVPVVVFDPVEHATAGLEAKGVAHESLSRFAVLTVALTEADRPAPIIDFANVRRRIEKSRFNRSNSLAAAAIGLVAISFAFYAWRQITEPSRKLEALQDEIKAARGSRRIRLRIFCRASCGDRSLVGDRCQLAGSARPIRSSSTSTSMKDKDFQAASDTVITQLTLRLVARKPLAGGWIFQRLKKCGGRRGAGTAAAQYDPHRFYRAAAKSIKVCPATIGRSISICTCPNLRRLLRLERLANSATPAASGKPAATRAHQNEYDAKRTLAAVIGALVLWGGWFDLARTCRRWAPATGK